MPREAIKIMVSSTVYGFERDLRVLCATIESYKSTKYEYKVLNSYIGTIYVAPGVSNTEACLRAVDECDFYTDIKNRVRNPDFEFKKTSVFEDIRIIDMYNEAIQDGQHIDKRRWAHEFGHFDDDEMNFIETEFKDINRLKEDLDKLIRLKLLQ